ncbi:hypothetical protein H920_08827 [Fukomys damarensis]|uniref:Uncharacterized protein n=1 Tax=Fukomys damarensis TaxID=885580 RepID=A0A091DF33_FUKDA|nr:hypothetical protein H920_08827 [Fukomys damarensis]
MEAGGNGRGVEGGAWRKDPERVRLHRLTPDDEHGYYVFQLPIVDRFPSSDTVKRKPQADIKGPQNQYNLDH